MAEIDGHIVVLMAQHGQEGAVRQDELIDNGDYIIGHKPTSYQDIRHCHCIYFSDLFQGYCFEI